MNSYYRDFYKDSASHMTRFFLPVFASLAVLSFSSTLLADSDEPPLFVAMAGRDSGNCQAVTAPCQTIAYALGQVGKNGRIRVGGGSYELSDIADTIYLLSGAIDVRGSYTVGSRSTLIGVAPEFAGGLEAKGFRVIVDTKGLNRAVVQAQLSLQSSAVATACVGGFADIFPCSNVDLLAHVADRTPAARGADIWGFMDLNTHREYAIVGYSSGAAVYDVTNAENPREVGFINGQSTTWATSRFISSGMRSTIAGTRWLTSPPITHQMACLLLTSANYHIAFHASTTQATSMQRTTFTF